jgi:hypothetical protein
MVHSPHGNVLHAINPKNKRTYCGHDMLKLWDKWRPVDRLPDDKNQPTCKICQHHYDDQIREDLRSIAKELKESIDEYLNVRCMLKDAEGLGLFVTTIASFMRSERKRAEAKKEGS